MPDDATDSGGDLADSPFTSDTPAAGDPTQATTEASSPARRLFDGSAEGPSVSELETDYGIPKSWSIALRGTLRVATGTGIPPIFEIGLGTSLGVANLINDDTEDNDGFDMMPSGDADSDDGSSEETAPESPGEPGGTHAG